MPPCVTVQIAPPCSISAAGPVELQLQSSPRPQGGDCLAPGSWHSVLEKLRHAPVVTFGTPQALADYQDFVCACIQQAASAAASDAGWSDCVDHLLRPLARALQLAQAGKTSSGRALAVELLGYAQLAQQVAGQLRGGGNAFTAPPPLDSNNQQQRSRATPSSSSATTSSSTSTAVSTSSTTTTTTTTSSTGSGSAGQFKVPALPLKRQRRPSSEEQLDAAAVTLMQQHQPSTPPLQPEHQQQQPQQQQQRRHAAPKRRATPQVWSGGPTCITAAAPPNSGMHGEACCDEELLASWCPISGKRLMSEPVLLQQQQQQQDAAAVSAAAAAGCGGASELQQAAGEVEQQQQQKSSAAAAAAALPPRASSTSTRSGSHMQQASSGGASAGAAAAAGSASALPPLSREAVSAARSDAIAVLKRSMHEDPASKPAADVLLFNKASQLPIVNWSGPIKHKDGDRVVEMCSLSLQVPEAFLEEFPGALYAADIRHRKSVSLGRHVVCRANLQPLSEHQLASLAAMARAQLVALCALQTAELHLVPYFDNKNHVRCVGFLKIKTAGA